MASHLTAIAEDSGADGTDDLLELLERANTGLTGSTTTRGLPVDITFETSFNADPDCKDAEPKRSPRTVLITRSLLLVQATFAAGLTVAKGLGWIDIPWWLALLPVLWPVYLLTLALVVALVGMLIAAILAILVITVSVGVYLVCGDLPDRTKPRGRATDFHDGFYEPDEPWDGNA